MSIRLEVSNTCTVRVKGTIPGGNGSPQPFDFTLICDRMDADELHDLTGSDMRLTDVMVARTRGWEHVLDADGAPLPFTEECLRKLFRIVGLSGVAFSAYVQACGAKGREKN